MIVGAAAERPMKQPLRFLGEQIIDARMPAPHQSGIVEFSVLISVGSPPLPRGVAGILFS
jgi:hypothetical protein